jgi:tetratricopeptide (TPR) repeat protein
MADLTELAQRMTALARHDHQSRIFGASMHRWEVFPLSAEDLEAARHRHGVETLPEAWRHWVSEGPGVGAGPFYGLHHPEDVEPGTDEHAHALPLSDQGCGYADWLMTDGERAGEVWVDFREGDGGVVRWYPSFADYLDAWLLRSYAEWGIEYLSESVSGDTAPSFLDAVREALERVTARPDDPYLNQYPLPLDKAFGALGTLHLAAGDEPAAQRAFDEAAALSREPDAWRALGRCRIASSRRDAEALLAAADEGLGAEPLWWITKGQLLVHRVNALEGLERWTEGLAAREAVADHFHNDVQKNLDLVWIRMLRKETDLAVTRLRDLATRGLGCDPKAPMPERLNQLTGGLLDALRREDLADRAALLEKALAELTD